MTRARMCRLAVAALLAGVGLARAAEISPALSPPLLLEAASALPDGARAAVWREAGVRSALLLRHGRLLPVGFPPAALPGLAAALRAPEAAGENPPWAAFPAADELVFDGHRYAGGNLRAIDALLGWNGRPVALDRELPALLVPLSPEAEVALGARRAAFQADAGSREVRAAAGAEGAALFAEGQFLRPYLGRFDDLYFHLFQNGNGASALAFCGLASGLGARTYQPVPGLHARAAGPAAAFDLDDLLSDGGKTAVQRHLRTLSATAGEPFQGFAFRVLPGLVAKLRTLPAGARFTANHGEILEALRTRQHLYPTRVPPLYRTPDRFLGWIGSFFLPVANGPALPPGVVDSWYPLPERTERAGGGSPAEGTGSALFESSSTPDIVWEDPQFSTLLTEPAAERPKTSAPASPAAESDPRLRTPSGRLLAVITPTSEEAQSYRAALAASDEKLRALEATRGRLRLLREFLESAATTGGAPEPLARALRADLASFAWQETDLATRLQFSLRERAGLRAELAARLQSDRVAPLETLGKKPAEAEAGAVL